jgi:xanthine dehydrogenase/oxidase
LYANNASVKYIEENLDGNLCRCTGYRPIWDAARSLCDDAEELVRGPCGTPCRECNERETCEQDCNESDKKQVVFSSSKDKMGLKNMLEDNKPNWKEQPNSMFPKELTVETSHESLQLAKPLMVVDETDYQGAGTWFKPSTLVELLTLLKEFGGPVGGGYKIVVGNTEVGIGESL